MLLLLFGAKRCTGFCCCCKPYEKEINDAAGKILLLDEPTASLDCLHQQTTLHKARELAQQGCTVAIVLHDLNLAAQFADKIVLLKNGRLVKQGCMRDVLRPAFIAKAYNMEVEAWEHTEYDFPVFVPATHKNGVIDIHKNKKYEFNSKLYVER